jgi:hypothetical protein
MTESKKLILPGFIIVALMGVAGGAALNALQVSAATDTSTTAAQSTAPTAQTQRDPAVGGHVGTNGTKEELLTGDTAAKVKAAAEAAVSGGTVERVENDAEGATYEAHMTKSDGTRVTVKLDKDFKVTGTENGGPGGR